MMATWPGNCLDSLPANGVGMGDLQLGWLLDDDQPFVHRNVVKKRFHQRRLPDPVPPLMMPFFSSADEVHNGIPN